MNFSPYLVLLFCLTSLSLSSQAVETFYRSPDLNTPAAEFSPATSVAVEISNDPELLVASIFQNQSCFMTENHSYQGFFGQWGTIQENISQLGTFTNGMDATGIEQGIILSTGRVKRAEGPNSFTGTTHVYATTSSDPDLIQLAGTNQLFDVCVVEFDFTPTTDAINFDYVFASEEYCEAVNNNNVDVFAFLISGPGINGPFSNGAENIAVLPDGSPVNVNTINGDPGNFNNLYRSNVPDSFNESCQTSPPVAPNDIEYDGMTTVLTASSSVIPCETYHLKMIIADVGDTFYDSAVLLEAGSFAAGLVNVSEPAVTAENGGLANAPLEGCSDGFLIFSRLDSTNIDDELTIYFNISPTSTATFGVDYTMPTDSFVIEAGQFSDTLLVDVFGDDLLEGTESIILRLGNTCNCEANTTEFFIVDPPEITLTIDQPDTLCAGSTGSIGPVVNGGVGTYQFSWSTGSTDSILNYNYTAGDSLYVISVTDNCAQTAVDSIVVSAPDISASVAGDYRFCPGSSATVPVVVRGDESYTITVSEDGNLVQYSGGPDTIFLTYTSGVNDLILINVIGASGCPGIVNGSATVGVSEFNVQATLNDVGCHGDSTGAIELDVNGASSDFTFTWSDTNLSGANLTGLGAGNYAVTITDTLGCTFDTSFTLSEPAISLGIQLDSIRNIDCTNDGYLAVTGTGGSPTYDFQWLDDNSSSPIRDGLAAGTYSVAISDTNGCTDTMSFSIVDTRPVITASISGTYHLCDDPSIVIPVVLSGGNNYTITIEENGTPQTYTGGPDTIFLTYTAATELLLTAVSADGCTGTVSGNITITVANFGLTATIDSVDCFGSATGAITLSLNGDESDYSYQWSEPGLSGHQLSGLNAGAYELTVTDGNGCQLDTVFAVGQPGAAVQLSLQSSTPQTCQDLASASIAASGGTPPYSYDWGDGGADSSDRDNLVGGQNYIITLTDSRGCSTTISLDTDDDRRVMDASIGGQLTQLSCQTTQIRLGAANNAAPVNYRWLDADGNQIGDLDSLTVTQPGTYQLIVSDPTNGCSDTSSIAITQSDDLLDLDTGGPYVIDCNLSVLALMVNVTNYDGAVTYRWTDENGTILANTNSLDNITSPGTFTVSVTRTDNGCTSTASVIVTEDRTAPGFSLSSGTISCNSPLATSSVIDPVGDYTYEWATTAGQIVTDPDQAEIQVNAPGTYFVTVTDPVNGCTTDTSLTVVEDFRELEPNAGQDQLLGCADGSGQLITGTAAPTLAGTIFTWRNNAGEVLSDNQNFTPDMAGTFTLEVTHPESGCTTTDDVAITQDALGELRLSLTQPPCETVGGTASILEIGGGIAPFQFTLNGEEILLTNNAINNLGEGNYLLGVTDGRGCATETAFQIFSPATFEGTTEVVNIRLGEDAELGYRTNRDSAIRSINWQAPLDLSCVNCPDPRVTQPTNSFTALVNLVDNAGCTLVLTQQVFVDRRDLVYAPTAFSPYRPEGINDKFTLYGDIRFVSSIDYLRIFNRWGGLIWEQNELTPNDESQGWDGYFNGQPLGGNIFVFVAQVTYFDGQTEIIRGEINILR